MTLTLPLLALLLTASLLCFAVTNLLLWPRLRSGKGEEAWPRVSVLIPARNEAHNIGACVQSLMRQDYPDWEVILLDDGSTDGTAEVAHRAAAGSNRLRVVRGRPLPDGWLGKSWACHQLAELASGAYLLYVDADTVSTPDMLRRAVDTALHHRADLLSGLAHQTFGSFSEAWLVVQQYMLIGTFLPVWMIPMRTHSSLAAATGAFLLFRREAYEQVGGHTAIKGSMVDDLALGRRLKARGGKLLFADITPVISCRMYRSGAEAWSGFVKNAYPAMGRSPFVLLVGLILIPGIFLGPELGLLYAAWTGAPRADQLLWSLATASSMGIGGMIYGRFGVGAWLGLTMPVQAVGFVAVAVTSAFNSWLGRGYRWKGRTYV